MLLNELYKRRKTLEEYLGICSKKLRNAPDGWLRTSLCRGHATYYKKKNKDDYRGTYLPYEENKELIRRLAEKEYYGKMEEEITRELKAINHLIEIERKERLSVVYCRMNPIKQSLVVPLEDSIENEIKRWKGVKYPVMEPKPGSYVIDLGVIGIGENGHIAFNDPPADFEATDAYRIVNLDHKCRMQQVWEGWFATEDDVPRQAISMLPRQIMSCKVIVSVVPHAVKAKAVYDTITQPVNNMVPATLMKTHPDWNLFIDDEAAALLIK